MTQASETLVFSTAWAEIACRRSATRPWRLAPVSNREAQASIAGLLPVAFVRAHLHRLRREEEREARQPLRCLLPDYRAAMLA
jgi:hypothetical protein